MLSGSRLTHGDELVNNSHYLKYNDPRPSKLCKVSSQDLEFSSSFKEFHFSTNENALKFRS